MKRNIKVINITPRGYCNGVIRAIKTVNNILNDNKYPKPLYMYGELVHNTHVTNALLEKGIIIIDDYKPINEGTIIITAHGLSSIEKEILKAKGLFIIDTTCKEVNKIQNIVKDKLLENYTVLYYGKKNHPECNAVLNDNPNVILISNEQDINNLNIKDENKIFFTNQTTMSYFDTMKIANKLKEKYSNVDVNVDICTASKQRQIAVYNQCKECDLVLIIGDKKSNNTNKLKEICDLLNKTSYLVETVDDLKNIDIPINSKIGITAGSSTPNILINEIIKSLEDDSYISNVKNSDYINI